jgi:hypothetical protein
VEVVVLDADLRLLIVALKLSRVYSLSSVESKRLG